MLARCSLILVAFCSISVNFPAGTPSQDLGHTREKYVKSLDSHEKYILHRENELWLRFSMKIAYETLIDDPILAERVTRALARASSDFDVYPWLMATLIRVESAGDPNAVSCAGAIGLTQIMPVTGREIAQKLKIEWTGSDMLFDPELNIRMGTFYIRYLLDTFDGDLHATLAAYNWGPNNISQRISRGEPLPTQYPGKILDLEHLNGQATAQAKSRG